MKQLVMAIVAATANNITFAFFMLHSIYCKFNEYHAKFLMQWETLITQRLQNQTDAFELKRQFGEAWPLISEHLHCLPKAAKKLPEMANAGCYFARVPFEQSSSERVAGFHAQMAGKGRVLSITGGLGADDFALAKAGNAVLSLDPDPGLNALVAFNQGQMRIESLERRTISAEDFLKTNNQTFDLVFADPDRRPGGERAHGVAELYQPDVFKLMELYPNLAARWLIKLSPMTDLAWLQNRVKGNMDIYVVAADTEVKEVFCDIRQSSTNKIAMFELKPALAFEWDGEKIVVETVKESLFYEANAATIKSGLNRQMEGALDIQSENSNQSYFTGHSLVPGEIARTFLLQQKLSGSLSQILGKIREAGIFQANISSRDFVMDTESLRKKSGLTDGGETYLFFTGKTEKSCFICRKP